MAYRWMIAIVAGLIVLAGIGVAIVLMQYGLPGHEGLAKRIEALGGSVKLRDDQSSNQPRIVRVYLGETNLGDDDIPQYIPASSVEVVSLTGMELGENTLSHLGQCRSLQRLYLDCTNIVDEDLLKLRELPQLNTLGISYTAITDNGLSHLQKCETLQSLTALETHVTAGGVEDIRNCLPNIDVAFSKVPSEEAREAIVLLRPRELTVNFVRGYEVLPEDIPEAYAVTNYGRDLEGALVWRLLRAISAARPTCIDLKGSNTSELARVAQLPNVFGLSFSSTAIKDDDLIPLKALSNLRLLQIEYCRITDDSLATISELSKLERLAICKTEATDAGLSQLVKLSSLKVLTVEDQQFSETGLAHVAKIPSLEILVLCEWSMTDDAISMLKALPKLRELHLNDCPNLTDAVLQQLEKFESLEKLTFCGCRRVSEQAIGAFDESHPDIEAYK